MAVRPASIPLIPGSKHGLIHDHPSQPAWTDAKEPRMPRSASFTHLPETLEEKSEYDDASRPKFSRAKSDGPLPEHSKGRSEKRPSQAAHQSSFSTSSVPKQRSFPRFRTAEKSSRKHGAEKGQLEGNVPYDSTVTGAPPRTDKPPRALKKGIFKTSAVSSLDGSAVPYNSTIAGAPPRMEARPLISSDALSELSKKSSNSSRSSSHRKLEEERAKVSAASLNIAAAKLKNARQGIPSVNTSSRPKSPERLTQKPSKSHDSQTNDAQKPANGILRSLTSEGSSISRSSSMHSRDRSKVQRSPSIAKSKSIPIVLNMPTDGQPPMPTSKKKVDELARPVRALETEFEK